MFSADGEFVSFNKAVSLDNPVEVTTILWFWGGGNCMYLTPVFYL